MYISQEKVEKYLKNIDITKATGSDNIGARLLKLAAPFISDSLMYICNQSILNSTFPDKWKEGKVRPLYKNGPKDDTNNYRTISILPVISKMLEKHVHDSLSPYLTGLRLFCDSWRQTSRVGRKAVSKQSPVIRNFLACVAKWRKVVAKILNMFKNFMRQNSSQNGRKVIAGVSNPSRTCRRPLAI